MGEAYGEQDRIGRYVVERCVGFGAMGVVYLAHDAQLDRRVALKLMRPDTTGPEALVERKARLQREAQAMARLSHPNVVAVHDVGEHAGQLYIAMEFIDGQTLREWLRGRARPWRERLDALIHAGEGLAAAHAAGLVHRDFKPDNVLVGKDGRIRVTDFGLARSTESEVASQPIVERGAPLVDLTQSGVLIGTPFYMAPEVLDGSAADPLSDQFSYCVALYEALYGERPFHGGDVAELERAIHTGRPREAPRDSRVPLWLRRVVLRGLHAVPGQRYPSMDILLSTLRLDPATRRRRVVLGLAAAATVVALVAFARAWAPAQLCRGAEQRLLTSWDGERRRAAHAAFVAAGGEKGEEVWSRVEPMLDAYGRSWSAMHTSACEATRVRGEQSDAMLSLRMTCLDRRLEELGALTELFVRAAGPALDHAIVAAEALTPLAVCADTAALTARVAPPGDPELARQVQQLRARLAQAKAREQAGLFVEGRELARQVVTDAVALSYRPIVAEALFRRGVLEARSGDPRTALRSLLDAVSAAEASRDDTLAVEVWSEIMFVEGDLLERTADAQRSEERAVAAIERIGDNGVLRAQLLDRMGLLRRARGEARAAIEKQRAALELSQRLIGRRDPRLAELLRHLAMALRDDAQLDEAGATFARALAVEEEALGAHHPNLADTLNGWGMTESIAGRYVEAEAHHRRALEIRERSFGPLHDKTGESLHNLAMLLVKAGHPEQAIPYDERALAAYQAVFGASHATVAMVHNGLGLALKAMGRLAPAHRHFEQALEMRQKQGGDDPATAAILANLADVASAQGRGAEAIAFAERARIMDERSLRADHPAVGFDLTALGRAFLAAGRPRDAVAPLERALALFARNPTRAQRRGEASFALARALESSGADRARARSLAREARTDFENAGGEGRRDLESVDAWLSRH